VAINKKFSAHGLEEGYDSFDSPRGLFMVSKILTVAAVALSLVISPSAQQPDSRSQATSNAQPATVGQTSIEIQPNPDDDRAMIEWLNTQGKTVERLLSLGVKPEIAESITKGDTDIYVRWQTPRANTHERYGLLFLPCHVAWDFAYIFTLTRQETGWHVSDSAWLDCHYDQSVSYETMRIRDPNRDEILVHHACAGHAASYLEQDLSVFAVSEGKLKEELEVEEVEHSSRIGGPPHVLDQNSTFTLVPVRNSRSRAIEETRSSTLNGKLTVQRRIFRWNAARGKYVPSAFTTVEASPN
jgi:hypothetical protein